MKPNILNYKQLMIGFSFQGVMKMLPKNVILMREFERQDRARLQKEAENARSLQRTKNQTAPRSFFPTWEFTRTKFRFLRTLLNPTS